MDGWHLKSSPFHKGERLLHERLGISERQEQMGRRMMRGAMPDQHRDFFGQLPFVVMGSVDKTGAPWASLLAGSPGFVETPTDTSMRINVSPLAGDPMSEGLDTDAPVSLLGIEPHTRRRNRANFRVNGTDEAGFDLRLTMSFGNCPQYIQARRPHEETAPLPEPTREDIELVTPDAERLIRRADTFFVASHNDQDDPETIGGVDVNHRGGKPGFVKVDGNILTIPDFRGNNAFNTLGNFLINPKAGLLFVDFDTGDLLQMTGHVDVLFDASEEATGFEGAQRIWRFTFASGHFLRKAISADWSFDDYAPQLDRTGQWNT